jgi:hypothetical protein
VVELCLVPWLQSKDLLVFLEVRLQMAAVEEVGVGEGKTVVMAVLAVLEAEVRAAILVALQLKQPMD